jgi:hypothetical protein
MLIHRRGERHAFADRFRNVFQHGAHGRVLFFLRQAFEGLRYGNRCAEE